MHYLVTGHTGFKGSWLVLMLTELGHEVSGISLDPQPGSLFETAGISSLMKNDIRLDIRDSGNLKKVLEDLDPEVLVHMAAQPLVRESYLDPRFTFETNVNGTLNVLEASELAKSMRARLVVTTDKVYRNVGKSQGYIESDPLGGFDPYSSSKAMADILTQSWRSSFPSTPLSIARAGNVIGGGDISKDRLIPDLVSASRNQTPLEVRSPSSVRPWQHVLDCLAGYLSLIELMIKTNQSDDFNFGPEPLGFKSVSDVIRQFEFFASTQITVISPSGEAPHEAALLTLESSKATRLLNWQNRISFEKAIELTVRWHAEELRGTPPIEISRSQVRDFLTAK